MTFARRSTSRIAALAVGAGLLVSTQGAPAWAADPVDGALTSGDRVFPNQGNGGYDALHYDLDLSVNVTTSTVVGQAATTTIPSAVTTMRARTTGAPLRSFGLDLQGLVVSSVLVNGVPATFRREETTNTTDVTQDVHKLVVTPATPVDGEFTTVVSYSGTPVSHTDADGSSEGWNNTTDGATSVNQPVGAMTAFPHNDTPSDKATYTMDLDVPTTITNLVGSGPAAAVSNGELLSKTVSSDGTRTTWSWGQRKQMASELLIISVGKYDVRTSDVTLSDGRVVPEWSFIDSGLSAGNKTTFDNRRAAMPGIIRGLETLFGPYPGNSVGVVVDAVPRTISYALETQDRSFFPSAGSLNGDTLTHELTHQWYGDAVAPVTWNDIWINEGMAEWAPIDYDNRIASTSPDTTESVFYDSWDEGTEADYENPPATFTDAATLYEYQTYTRSAQMYEALKGSIGDAAYFAFVEEWQTRFTGRSHGTADFMALAEEVSGRDLDAFFADWLFDADKPAWVQRWTPSMSADTSSAPPGSTVTWTVSAANVGKVDLTSSVASIDLADVLDDATLDPATLPAGLSLTGTRLTWAVPTTATGATSTLSFPVTVEPSANAVTLSAVVSSPTLGGICATACSSAATVPLRIGAATVSGTPAVGSRLTAVPSGVPAGTTTAYQWRVAGSPVAGATGPTYVPVAADLGRDVSVVVTVSKPGFTTVSETSAPTAPVAIGAKPATAEPVVKGRLQVGNVLRVRAPTLAPGAKVTYRWKVAGQRISTARGARFGLRPRWAGRRVVLVTITSTPGLATVRTRTPLGRIADR